MSAIKVEAGCRIINDCTDGVNKRQCFPDKIKNLEGEEPCVKIALPRGFDTREARKEQRFWYVVQYINIFPNMGEVGIFEKILESCQMRQKHFLPLWKWVLTVDKPLQRPDIVLY